MRESSSLTNEVTEQKHVHEPDVSNDDDKITDSLAELIRPLRKSRAVQVRQELATPDMSRRHWHDEGVLWHESCLYVPPSLIGETSPVRDKLLAEHLM